MDLWCFLFTDPISRWTVITAPVADSVEYQDDGKGGVISNDCLGGTKLTLMHNIKPWAENQDPRNAVKCCL